MAFHEPQAPYALANSTDETQTLRVSDEPLREKLRESWRQKRWLLPFAIFVGSLVLFSLASWDRVTRPSSDPHFAYLANTYNAELAELVDDEVAARRAGLAPFQLEKRPPHRNDWASYWDITTKSGERFKGIWLDKQGSGRFKTLDKRIVVLDAGALRGAKREQRFFVSFPPAPAVLMMPLAAVWGYEVNDVAFTIFFAALNVMLMFLLLRRLSEGGRTGRGRNENLWLTLLFGFGTAHLWCSVLGQVWFTALIVGVFFTLLYIYFAIDARHPILAGLALALAFSTRTPLVFSAVFFYIFVLFPGGSLRQGDWGDAFKKAALFSLPPLVIGIALLVQNYVRFESLSEFGHTYLAAGSLERIQKYGLFHSTFLSKNLSAMLTLMPKIWPQEPYILISKHGMSLFLTTPAFIYLFRPLARENARDRFWWTMLWVTVAAVGVPALFYQNTGYEQFGYRFSLDYLPYLILLLAVGRRPLSKLFKALVIWGIAVNTFGAITFKRFGKFYSNGFFV